MWIKSEKRYWAVNKTPMPLGAVMKVDAETLASIQYLVDSGDFSLHETDPAPKQAPKKTKKAPSRSRSSSSSKSKTSSKKS